MQQGAGKNRGLIVLSTVLGLIGGGMIVYFSARGRAPAAPIIVSTPVPTSTLPPPATPAPIRVYVSGAVRSPAVYELPRGSIIQDAVKAAGGPASEADLDSINLALELQDQQHVRVPREGGANPQPVISGGASRSGETLGHLVDINAATADELQTLPGVGEVTAQRIIEYREANGPFDTVEDIQNVSGIGPKTFDGFEEMITVGQ
ncbi:MAG: ComEA family DNA-binding protein [Anaerolineae bacterium]|jgi:competence protein ComEA